MIIIFFFIIFFFLINFAYLLDKLPWTSCLKRFVCFICLFIFKQVPVLLFSSSDAYYDKRIIRFFEILISIAQFSNAVDLNAFSLVSRACRMSTLFLLKQTNYLEDSFRRFWPRMHFGLVNSLFDYKSRRAFISAYYLLKCSQIYIDAEDKNVPNRFQEFANRLQQMLSKKTPQQVCFFRPIDIGKFEPCYDKFCRLIPSCRESSKTKEICRQSYAEIMQINNALEHAAGKPELMEPLSYIVRRMCFFENS